MRIIINETRKKKNTQKSFLAKFNLVSRLEDSERRYICNSTCKPKPSYCVWIIRSKAAEKGIAKIKKNEYQRNIKVMPRGLVLGQNICSPGAGHSFSFSLMPTAPKCIFCTGSWSRALPVPHRQQRADIQPRPTGWVGEEWFAPYVKEKRQDLVQEFFFYLHVDKNFVPMSSRMQTGCGKQENLDVLLWSLIDFL